MSTRIRDRYSFANIEEALPLPDLVAIQRESFQWFLDQGLKETFADISPIKDFTETLQLELEFDPTDEDLQPGSVGAISKSAVMYWLETLPSNSSVFPFRCEP